MINEDIVKIKIFQTKKVLLQSNFDTRLKLHIHLYIMGHPFSMSIIIHWLTCFLQFVLRLEIRNRVTFSEIFEYVLNEHQTQRPKKKKPTLFVQLLKFHRLFSVKFHFGYCLLHSPRLFWLKNKEKIDSRKKRK